MEKCYEYDILVTDYNQEYCPVCGGKIIHPYTGQVTSEQLEEQANCCTWIEVQDENNSTLGWNPICKNVGYIVDKNNNMCYNFLDLINSNKTENIDTKVKFVKEIIKKVTGKEVELEVKDNTIIVRLIDYMDTINVTLTMNENDEIEIK